MRRFSSSRPAPWAALVVAALLLPGGVAAQQVVGTVVSANGPVVGATVGVVDGWETRQR